MLQLHKNNNYYFRYSIPKEFQILFNTKEVLKSLKTKNKQQAEVLYSDNIKEIEYIFYLLRLNMLTDSEVTKIIDDYKKNAVEKTNKLFTRLPDIHEVHKLINFEEQKNILKNMFVDGNFTKVLHFDESALAEYDLTNDDLEAYKSTNSVADITKELLEKFNIRDCSDKDFNNIAEEVAATKIGLLDYLESLLLGTVSLDDPYGMNSYITNNIANTATIVTSIQDKNDTYKITGITLEEAWEMYIKNKREIKNISISSVKGYDSSKKYLEIFYPKETDIGFFTKNIFDELLYNYMKLPVTTFNKNEYKIMSYEELSTLPDEILRLNNKTINAKFVNYKDLFKFLVKKGYLELNPVNVDSLSEETSDREPFSVEDINMILNADIEQYIKDICLVALYSGMRIGEMCLLKKTGLKEENNIRYFDIKKGETQTKTKNSVRTIPIHKDIESTVDKFLNTTEGEFLFLEPTKGRADFKTQELYEDNIKKMFSKRVNRILNKIVVSKQKTFHSFRKNFAVELYRGSSSQEAFIKYLMGHSISHNITLSTYGQVHIEILNEMVQKISYDIKL